jgi:site-specific DNA-methyltransferase (cytosine-N4-specific)
MSINPDQQGGHARDISRTDGTLRAGHNETNMMETHHKVVFRDSRVMRDLEDSSVHLVVTSPPYPMIEMWDSLFMRMDPHIAELLDKARSPDVDRRRRQVNAVYEAMHRNLAEVWSECYRILREGGIACINIGDATRNIGGEFRLFPNHSKIIEHCERIGFVTLPFIAWKKPTNKPNAFLGSGFLPTNAYVTLDLEYILILRKGGTRKFTPKDSTRYSSSFTKAQRDVWFSQIWSVRGAAQSQGKSERRTAAFPEEIPRRLIRMFSIIGDTVLDPFLGTGTTMKVAGDLGRHSVGYELDGSLKQVIKSRLGPHIIEREDNFEFNRTD